MAGSVAGRLRSGQRFLGEASPLPTSEPAVHAAYMTPQQLSFFHPVSTVTGQTAWARDECEARLAEIRATQRTQAMRRFNAAFLDPIYSDPVDGTIA